MKKTLIPLICSLATIISCTSYTKEIAEEITPIPFNEVELTGGFWLDRIEAVTDVTVPYSLEQVELAVERFRRCALFLEGKKTKEPEQMFHRFISSDVSKVIEGAAYSLMVNPDPELEKEIDIIIDYMARAQQEDGYLYIAHTFKKPDIFKEGQGSRPYSWVVMSHELYNVGHMYEAAVAYYQATGKDKLLNVSIKSAKHVNKVFFEGGDPNYNYGIPVMQAPGHQEIELALCKLYRVTGDTLYLDMARKFLDIRGITYQIHGKGVMSGEYAQQHIPVVEQTEAVGHAVRATYQYTAMAQVDALSGTNTYDLALNTIWDDLVSTRMHITGGLGAVHGVEGFGAQYYLPNKETYNETCASVGNVFFNHAMYLASGDSRFLDIAELSLYNNSLAGINLKGDRFFYVNPLEADGTYKFNHGFAGRFAWSGCACCPPNISRLILQVPGYMYSYGKDKIYLTMYGSSKTTIPLEGLNVKIEEQSEYPFDGKVKISVDPEKSAKFSMYMRIPTWAGNDEFVPGGLYDFVNKTEPVSILVNGEEVSHSLDKGFAVVSRTWSAGDIVELNIPMPVRFVESNPKVEANIGSIAVTRGPLVYCAEEIDNKDTVQNLVLRKNYSGDVNITEMSGSVMHGIKKIELDNIALVPYYSWSNRGDNKAMIVWLNDGTKESKPE